MRRLYERTDEAIEAALQAAAQLLDASGTPERIAAEIAAATRGGVHSTHRTDAAPWRPERRTVSAVDRRRQFGDAHTEAATYPVLVGAPVGSMPNRTTMLRDARASQALSYAEQQSAAWAKRNAKAARKRR